MSKKLIIAIIIILIVIVVATVLILAKNSKNNDSNNNITNNNENNAEVLENENKESPTETNKNNLVLYFSATGNTKNVAKAISKVANADMIEIVPKDKYSSEDLNYNNNNSRANIEQNDNHVRPEIESIENIDKYNIIYLGYPIWWGDVPKVILTLLDNYNLDGKTVIPFCTSGSSGISQSMNTLKAYNKNVNWLEGKRFSSSASEDNIREWIKELNISQENTDKREVSKMYIKINNEILTATLENNSSADALIEKLKQNDITINMHDYSNFEKVGELGFNLPRNDKQISTDYGDLILYQGNNFVIYYDKNNWNFTKLGHIDNISQNELKSILGDNNVTVTLSLEK